MTHSRWQGGRLARALASALILAGAITAIGLARALAAPAADCQNWTGTQPPNPGGVSETLNSVAISSACDAWAVGFQTGGGTNVTLTEHWDGSHWTRVPSPTPGANAQLDAVAASSASNIWAVGIFSNGTDNALAVHCC